MQTSCPNCSNRLVVDDAKVPATPFMLKCPKCQGMVKLPGKGSQPAPSAAAPAGAPPAARAAAPTPAPQPAMPAAPASGSPFAPLGPIPAPPNPIGKAIVAIPAADVATAVGTVLARLGFLVEGFDGADDKLLKLQQGDYAIIATPRNGIAEDKSVYRMVQVLPPEIRRRVFLVLTGEDVQTGDGTTAFALQADLLLNPKDAPQSDRLFAQTLHERRRVYQTYWDTEDRKMEGRL